MSHWNTRRIDLLRKRREVGLTVAEFNELQTLQEIVRQEVDRRHPLPFDHIKELTGKTKG